MQKQHIQIKDSYNTWLPETMKRKIKHCVPDCKDEYALLVIEWWLHNIGYWVTLPFNAEWIKEINLHCKDVDLMVERQNIEKGR